MASAGSTGNAGGARFKMQADGAPSALYRSTDGRGFTTFGFRCWSEKVLELSTSIKIFDAPCQNTTFNQLRGVGLRAWTETLRTAKYTGGRVNPADYKNLLTDSALDTASLMNCGFDNINGTNPAVGTQFAGRSMGCGEASFAAIRNAIGAARRRNPALDSIIQDTPWGRWEASGGGGRRSREVVVYIKNGNIKFRAFRNQTGGKDSLDLFTRTWRDKDTLISQMWDAGGMLNAPGEIWIAPYCPSIHAGVPYWGDLVGVTDDPNDLFCPCVCCGDSALCGKDGCECIGDNASFPTIPPSDAAPYAPTVPRFVRSAGSRGNIFDYNVKVTNSSFHKGSYNIKNNQLYRFNCDCPTELMKLGKYKKYLPNGQGQDAGSGSFHEVLDDSDKPTGWSNVRRKRGCARYLSFKWSGLNHLGLEANYDTCDETHQRPILTGKSLVDLFDEEQLWPYGQEGCYLYVFVFYGWEGEDGDDRTRWQSSDRSWRVWKVEQNKNPLCSNWKKP